MKVLKICGITKPVNYHGIAVDVPNDHYYLATSANGHVRSFETEPTKNLDLGAWLNFKRSVTLLLVVDLDGVNWEHTLKEIE